MISLIFKVAPLQSQYYSLALFEYKNTRIDLYISHIRYVKYTVPILGWIVGNEKWAKVSQTVFTTADILLIFEGKRKIQVKRQMRDREKAEGKKGKRKHADEAEIFASQQRSVSL